MGFLWISLGVLCALFCVPKHVPVVLMLGFIFLSRHICFVSNIIQLRALLNCNWLFSLCGRRVQGQNGFTCLSDSTRGGGGGEGWKGGVFSPSFSVPFPPQFGPGSWRVFRASEREIRGVTASEIVKTAAQATRLAGAAFPRLEVLWHARCALTLGSTLSLLFVIYCTANYIKTLKIIPSPVTLLSASVDFWVASVRRVFSLDLAHGEYSLCRNGRVNM